MGAAPRTHRLVLILRLSGACFSHALAHEHRLRVSQSSLRSRPSCKTGGPRVASPHGERFAEARCVRNFGPPIDDPRRLNLMDSRVEMMCRSPHALSLPLPLSLSPSPSSPSLPPLPGIPSPPVDEAARKAALADLDHQVSPIHVTAPPPVSKSSAPTGNFPAAP